MKTAQSQIDTYFQSSIDDYPTAGHCSSGRKNHLSGRRLGREILIKKNLENFIIETINSLTYNYNSLISPSCLLWLLLQFNVPGF